MLGFLWVVLLVILGAFLGAFWKHSVAEVPAPGHGPSTPLTRGGRAAFRACIQAALLACRAVLAAWQALARPAIQRPALGERHWESEEREAMMQAVLHALNSTNLKCMQCKEVGMWCMARGVHLPLPGLPEADAGDTSHGARQPHGQSGATNATTSLVSTSTTFTTTTITTTTVAAQAATAAASSQPTPHVMSLELHGHSQQLRIVQGSDNLSHTQPALLVTLFNAAGPAVQWASIADTAGAPSSLPLLVEAQPGHRLQPTRSPLQPAGRSAPELRLQAPLGSSGQQLSPDGTAHFEMTAAAADVGFSGASPAAQPRDASQPGGHHNRGPGDHLQSQGANATPSALADGLEVQVSSSDATVARAGHSGLQLKPTASAAEGPNTPSGTDGGSSRTTLNPTSPPAQHASTHLDHYLGSRLSIRDGQPPRRFSLSGTGTDTLQQTSSDQQPVAAPVAAAAFAHRRRMLSTSSSSGRNNFAAIAAANRAVASVVAAAASASSGGMATGMARGLSRTHPASTLPARSATDPNSSGSSSSAAARDEAPSGRLGEFAANRQTSAGRSRRHSADCPVPQDLAAVDVSGLSLASLGPLGSTGQRGGPASAGGSQSNWSSAVLDSLRDSWWLESCQQQPATSPREEMHRHSSQGLMSVWPDDRHLDQLLGTCAPTPHLRGSGTGMLSMSGLVCVSEAASQDLSDEGLERPSRQLQRSSQRPPSPQAVSTTGERRGSYTFSFSGRAQMPEDAVPGIEQAAPVRTRPRVSFPGLSPEGRPTLIEEPPSPDLQHTSASHADATKQSRSGQQMLGPSPRLSRTSLPSGIPADLATSVIRGKKRDSNHSGSSARSGMGSGPLQPPGDGLRSHRSANRRASAAGSEPSHPSPPPIRLPGAQAAREERRSSAVHGHVRRATTQALLSASPRDRHTVEDNRDRHTLEDSDFQSPPPCTFDIMAAAFGWHMPPDSQENLDSMIDRSMTGQLSSSREERDGEYRRILSAGDMVGQAIRETHIPMPAGQLAQHQSQWRSSAPFGVQNAALHSMFAPRPSLQPVLSVDAPTDSPPPSALTLPPVFDKSKLVLPTPKLQPSTDSPFVVDQADWAVGPEGSPTGADAQARPGCRSGSAPMSTIGDTYTAQPCQPNMGPSSAADAPESGESSSPQGTPGQGSRVHKKIGKQKSVVHFKPGLTEDLIELATKQHEQQGTIYPTLSKSLSPDHGDAAFEALLQTATQRHHMDQAAGGGAGSEASTQGTDDQPSGSLVNERLPYALQLNHNLRLSVGSSNHSPAGGVMVRDARMSRSMALRLGITGEGSTGSTGNSPTRMAGDATPSHERSPFEVTFKGTAADAASVGDSDSNLLPKVEHVQGLTLASSGALADQEANALHSSLNSIRGMPAPSSVRTSGASLGQAAAAAAGRAGAERPSATPRLTSSVGHRRVLHYSDAPQHNGRMKVLLVSADASKMVAVGDALPSKRYELHHASGTDCLRLMSVESSYLPDVVLVDMTIGMLPLPIFTRRRRGSASGPMEAQSAVSASSSGALDWSRGSSQFQPSGGASGLLPSPSSLSLAPSPASNAPAAPLTALDLLITLRKIHDPSTLSIIMLASLRDDSKPNPALPMETEAETPHTTAAHEGVAGLMHGANDYMVLPVLPVELEARINMQVALRRAVRIKAEASSSMQLLRAILPGHVIRKLKQGKKYIAQHHEDVSIGFIDIVGFTRLSATWPSSKVARMLNDLFSRFDDICERHGVYHVDTIGDGYMVLCGHDGESDHALKVLRAANDMIEVTRHPLLSGEIINLRIGINTGPAHSGVLGTRRFKYTVWGDSVNCASRMESSGFPSCIQVSSSTYRSAMTSMIAHRNEDEGEAVMGRAASGTDAASGLKGWDSERPSLAASSVMRTSASENVSIAPVDSSSRWGESVRPSQANSAYDSRADSRGDLSRLRNGFTPRASDTGETLEFQFAALGLREIKGKGLMATFLVKVAGWQEAYEPYLLEHPGIDLPPKPSQAISTSTMMTSPAQRASSNVSSVSPGMAGAWDSPGTADVVSRLRTLHTRILDSEDTGAPTRTTATSNPPICPESPTPVPDSPAPHALVGMWRNQARGGATAAQPPVGELGDRVSDVHHSSLFSSRGSLLQSGPIHMHNVDDRANTGSSRTSHGLALDSTVSEAWRSSHVFSGDYHGSHHDSGPPPRGSLWGAATNSFSHYSSQHLSSQHQSSQPHSSPNSHNTRHSDRLCASDSAPSVGPSNRRRGEPPPQQPWHHESSGGPATQLEAQLQTLLGPHCLDNLDQGKRAALVAWVHQQLGSHETPAPELAYVSSPTSEVAAQRSAQFAMLGSPHISELLVTQSESSDLRGVYGLASPTASGSQRLGKPLTQVLTAAQSPKSTANTAGSGRGQASWPPGQQPASPFSTPAGSQPASTASFTNASGSPLRAPGDNIPTRNPFGREVRFASATTPVTMYGTDLDAHVMYYNNPAMSESSIDGKLSTESNMAGSAYDSFSNQASRIAHAASVSAAYAGATGRSERGEFQATPEDGATSSDAKSLMHKVNKSKSMSNLRALLKGAAKAVRKAGSTAYSRQSSGERLARATSMHSAGAQSGKHRSMSISQSGSMHRESSSKPRSFLHSLLNSSVGQLTAEASERGTLQGEHSGQNLGKVPSSQSHCSSEAIPQAVLTQASPSIRSGRSHTESVSLGERAGSNRGSPARVLQFRLTSHGTLEPGISDTPMPAKRKTLSGMVIDDGSQLPALSARRASAGGSLQTRNPLSADALAIGAAYLGIQAGLTPSSVPQARFALEQCDTQRTKSSSNMALPATARSKSAIRGTRAEGRQLQSDNGVDPLFSASYTGGLGLQPAPIRTRPAVTDVAGTGADGILLSSSTPSSAGHNSLLATVSGGRAYAPAITSGQSVQSSGPSADTMSRLSQGSTQLEGCTGRLPSLPSGKKSRLAGTQQALGDPDAQLASGGPSGSVLDPAGLFRALNMTRQSYGLDPADSSAPPSPALSELGQTLSNAETDLNQQQTERAPKSSKPVKKAMLWLKQKMGGPSAS